MTFESRNIQISILPPISEEIIDENPDSISHQRTITPETINRVSSNNDINQNQSSPLFHLKNINSGSFDDVDNLTKSQISFGNKNNDNLIVSSPHVQISYLPNSDIENNSNLINRKTLSNEEFDIIHSNEDNDDIMLSPIDSGNFIEKKKSRSLSSNYVENRSKTIKIKKIRVGSNIKSKYQTPDKEYSLYSQRSNDIKEIENQWYNFVNKRINSLNKLKLKNV